MSPSLSQEAGKGPAEGQLPGQRTWDKELPRFSSSCRSGRSEALRGLDNRLSRLALASEAEHPLGPRSLAVPPLFCCVVCMSSSEVANVRSTRGLETQGA